MIYTYIETKKETLCLNASNLAHIHNYAAKDLRPFWRRLLSTRRPFLVLILLRKPCTFLRVRFFGW